MNQPPPTASAGTQRPAPTKEAPNGGWKSFVRLLTFWGPFKGQVTAVAIIGVTVVAARMVLPYQTGVIVDLLEQERYAEIDRAAIIFCIAAAAMVALGAVRRILSGTISLGIEQLLRERLFGHLSRLSFTYFDRQQTGQLLSRVTSDVTMVRFFLGYGLTYFFMHISTIIIVPIVILWISPPLAGIVLVMMVSLFPISLRYSRRSHPILKEVQQRNAEVTAHGEETIVGARVVRAFGQEERENRRYRELVDRVVDQEHKAMLVNSRYKPLYSLIPNLTLATVMLVGGILINDGRVTIGNFFAFYGYIMVLTRPLTVIGNLLGRAQRATASGERLWEILDTDEVVPEPEVPTPLPPRSDRGAAIEFRSVSFSFREDRPVLDDVTLTIEPGSTIALLGPTGCGKTTLTALLPRFYDPSQGAIYLDGIDLRELRLEELRRSIGIVDQEPFLFSATVADNLRFGAAEATDDDVRRALEQAQAIEFVEELPQGINTMVGERGLTLSGGQRQRLAIARALISNPRVLILDDATASVDSQVESRISEALGAGSGTRTTIIIAHRPSTIQLADTIVVMRAGRIEDQGTHDELLARSRTYQLVYEQRESRREFLVAADGEAQV